MSAATQAITAKPDAAAIQGWYRRTTKQIFKSCTYYPRGVFHRMNIYCNGGLRRAKTANK